jgi:flagellar motor switch protein FliG
MSTMELTGPQKAALLLVQLGKERSAPILRSMADSEVEELMVEVARIDNVRAEVVQQVMTEFVSSISNRMRYGGGGIRVAKDMLEMGLGAERAKDIMSRIDAGGRPFEFLRSADPRQVMTFLHDEHPQTIALVLAHLTAEHAASLLAWLPLETQSDVAHRIAVMERPSPEVVRQVEEALELRLSNVGEHTTGEAIAGGVLPLVNILNRSNPTVGQAILERLEQADVDLADEVRRRMFVFEDIITLDDRTVQLVLREVDTKDLAVALKGTGADVRQKVMGNLSERAAGNLAEEIDLLGPVRLRDVEEARDNVVKVIRALEEAGQIVLSRSGDEFVE